MSTVVELVIPYERGDVLAELHREGEIVSESHGDDGVRVRARLDPAARGSSRRVRGAHVMTLGDSSPSSLPQYPYDRLDEVAAVAERHEGGMVDLSVGTPCDPPPESVVRALATSNSERGYPAVDRQSCAARRGEPLDRSAVRCRRAGRARRVHRHEGVRRHAAAVAAASATRPRHGALPGRVLSRPTRWARSSPRCRAVPRAASTTRGGST